MKVFISSTVYDLLDLRSVVEKSLGDIGVSPVLSESRHSAFDVVHDANSIGMCLVNVASSDAYVCILDKRYGPSLEKAGYDDISATHLEYRHAVDKGIPIHLFVRDRLESDFCIWKKNGRNNDIKYAWCEEPRLFKFLEEHRKLTEGANRSNWVHLFNNALDLCNFLKSLFEQEVGQEKLLSAIQSNRFPLFTLSANAEFLGPMNNTKVIVVLKLRNISQCPAFDFSMDSSNMRIGDLEKTVMSGEEISRVIELPLSYPGVLAEVVSLQYNTLFGVAVRESLNVFVTSNKEDSGRIYVDVSNRRRRYVRSSRPEIAIEIQ